MTLDFIPQPPGSRALDAGEWFAHATRLEAENVALQQMIVALLWHLAEHDEIGDYGRTLIDQRWPLEQAEAA